MLNNVRKFRVPVNWIYNSWKQISCSSTLNPKRLCRVKLTLKKCYPVILYFQLNNRLYRDANQNIVILPSHGTPAGAYAILSGWATFSDSSDVENLKKLSMKTIATEECQRDASNVVDGNQICATVGTGLGSCMVSSPIIQASVDKISPCFGRSNRQRLLLTSSSTLDLPSSATGRLSVSFRTETLAAKELPVSSPVSTTTLTGSWKSLPKNNFTPSMNNTTSFTPIHKFWPILLSLLEITEVVE